MSLSLSDLIKTGSDVFLRNQEQSNQEKALAVREKEIQLQRDKIVAEARRTQQTGFGSTGTFLGNIDLMTAGKYALVGMSAVLTVSAFSKFAFGR